MRILLRLISPLIQELLEHLEREPELLATSVLPRLRERVDQPGPALWTLPVGDDTTPILTEVMAEAEVRVGDLLRDPRNRDEALPAVALVLKRGDERMIMPDAGTRLVVGDELLLCGTAAARTRVKATLSDIYALSYLATGVERSRSWLLSRLSDSWSASSRA